MFGENQVIEAVNRFLMEWDPIGVVSEDALAGIRVEGEYESAETEYLSYAPVVARMLMEGADAATIADHLGKVALEQMGLKTDEERNRKIARKMVQWFAGRPSR